MLGGLYRRWRIHRAKQQGLQIADDCRIVGRVRFVSEPWLISIGRHVTICSDVDLITHDGGTWVFRDRPEYRKVIKYGRITIHDNCFIGQRATIMPGCSIGPNSVVAAAAVVTKSVPPGEVWGGVPARKLCTLDEYARCSLEKTPDYDEQAYHTDKRSELLRIFPRPW